MQGYYDGTKLLSLKDLNGQQPEIVLCCSNRSAGKTTWFGRWFVKRFLDHGEKFCLVYRYNYELTDIGSKFFKELKTLFFPEKEMESKNRAKGVYCELFLDGDPCGYAVSINNADQLKKMSHLFSDVKRILFDEFQSENNHYCENEIQKFISLHTSIARGNGEQVRFCPVYMLGNYVSLLNPYFTNLGIAERLRSDTNFMRGDGWVLEQGFNAAASQKQKSSAFNRAFDGNQYIAYAAEKVYLNDNTAFIDRPEGNNRYVCTILYDGKNYGIREYKEKGIVFCDTVADLSFPTRLTARAADHDINYLLLKQSDALIGLLRWYFEHGVFRFRNLECKKAILEICAYR